MTATAVIVLDGVLRGSGDKMLPAGARLYHGLREVMSVAVVTNEASIESADYWLKINGFHKHPYLLSTDPLALDDADARSLQIQRLRQAGSVIDFVIEPDPVVALHLLNQGVATLLFTHPRFTNPEHRPDVTATITPWETFVSEIERQESLKATDERLVTG